MRIRMLIACAALVFLAPSCKAMAVKGQHKASIDLSQKVNRGEELLFTVTLTDAAGQRANDIGFQWKIDWVGLPGSLHKGTSGVPSKIRVKGQPGKAVLYVFAADGGQIAEIAKQEFVVE
jgi:hypothetical protein